MTRHLRVEVVGPAAALFVAMAALGCKGPRGPVVHLTVERDADREVIANVHSLTVDIAVTGRDPTSLDFPEGGPRLTPIEFPADLAIIATGVRGTMDLNVEAWDETGNDVGRGVVTVELRGPRLYELTVEVGVTWSCGNDKSDLIEVCLVRDTDLELGAEDPNYGAIGNGVVFANFDGAGGPDLFAAWSGDFNSTTDLSGVSIFLGGKEAGTGTVYDPTTEIALVDATRLGNLEVAVMNLVGTTGPDPDNFNDVVVAARESNGLTIWAGRGDNTFVSPPFAIDLGEIPGELRVGNLLPDATWPGVEVAVGSRDAGFLWVVGHETPGMPPAPIASATVPVGVGTRGFVLVDLDGDMLLDMVVTSKGESEGPVNGELSVHENNGDGTFTSTTIDDSELGTRDVAVLDLDGDMLLDLATVNEETGILAFRFGITPFTFDVPVEIPLQLPGNPTAEPERIRVGDVNGDMIPDLLACDRSLGSVFVLLLDGSGGLLFPPVRTLVGLDEDVPGDDVQGCDVIDSDGDGALDLVAVVERGTNTLRVLRRVP